jgi:hypothetical protein
MKKLFVLIFCLLFFVSNGAQALTMQEILPAPYSSQRDYTGQGYDNPPQGLELAEGKSQSPIPPLDTLSGGQTGQASSFGGATGQVLGASTVGLVGHWKFDPVK